MGRHKGIMLARVPGQMLARCNSTGIPTAHHQPNVEPVGSIPSIELLQHPLPSCQQMMLRTTHSRVSPIKSITQQPLPSSLCSSAVRSELLTCADLLHHLANSIELSGSLAQILRQKVDPTVTCVVPNSKPQDREMPADPTTESPQEHQWRPAKRCRDDAASASAASKGKSSICQHGRIRRQCKDCGGSCICQHGRRRTVCKECGGSGICQHGRVRNNCKECASVYIGRTVTKQTVEHGVCEGTVVAFITLWSKYCIQYTDGTTAMLTKTALTKVLIPVVADETSAATAAEPTLALAVAAAAVAQEEAVTVVTGT